MKNLIATLVALTIPCLIFAQKIDQSFPTNNISTVALDFLYGEIIIEAYDGNEVEIKGQMKVNGELKEDVFTLDSKKSNGVLTLSGEADLDDIQKMWIVKNEDGSTVYKNDKKSIKIIYNDGKNGSAMYQGVDVESEFVIRVPRKMKLEVNSTYGSVTVKSYFPGMHIQNTYSDVTAVLTDVPSSPDMTIVSTYSDVDLALPHSLSASLRLKTGYGKIMTDMDIDTNIRERSGKGCEFGEDISATLNNGGGSISVEATYNNIYLRKI